MPVRRIEGIARLVAIGSAATLVLIATIAGIFQFARVVDLPPRFVRALGRFAQPAEVVLLVAAIAFLSSVLVAQQLRSATWGSWRGFALYSLGSALVAAGIANILLPMHVFPAEQLCTQVAWDVVVCEIRPWIGAPLAILLGAAAMQIGATFNHAAKRTTGDQ
jgi:hypothetical protein